MRSVWAVFLGVALAWLVAALVAVGIVAPLLMGLVGDRALPVAGPLVVFVAGFAFYFGGMYSAYKAPSYPRAHGVAVGVASFAVSPLLNLAGGGSFARLDEPAFLALTAAALVVVLAASYVGGRRGEAIAVHNARVLRDRKRQAALKKARQERGEDPEGYAASPDGG